LAKADSQRRVLFGTEIRSPGPRTDQFVNPPWRVENAFSSPPVPWMPPSFKDGHLLIKPMNRYFLPLMVRRFSAPLWFDSLSFLVSSGCATPTDGFPPMSSLIGSSCFFHWIRAVDPHFPHRWDSSFFVYRTANLHPVPPNNTMPFNPCCESLLVPVPLRVVRRPKIALRFLVLCSLPLNFSPLPFMIQIAVCSFSVLRPSSSFSLRSSNLMVIAEEWAPLSDRHAEV